MQNNVKKIVAREFLLLILAISIGLVSYGFVLINNYYFEQKIVKLTDEYYRLRKPYLSKLERQFWLTDIYIDRFSSNNSDYNTANNPENDRLLIRKDMWKYLFRYSNGDILKYKMGVIENKDYPAWDLELIEFLKGIGFDSSEKFKKFILESRISTKDAEDFNKSKSLSVELDSLRLNLYEIEVEGEEGEVYNKLNELFFNVTKFAFLVIFILRYLFLGIKWSYLTLREK